MTDLAQATDEEDESPPDPLLGRTLAGLYRIEELIGIGGIGRVYRAEHMALRKSVAVKVLLDEYQRVPNLKQRFQREAMTLAALSHPNIVTIHDFRSIGDQTFLVMELIDGDELTTIIEEGPLEPTRAFGIFRQILRCLAYAHAKGLIHRDLKPANVLVRELPDGSDHVEILDFGLAKFMDGPGGRSELTKTGLILGTPAYMAPEQGSGSKADTRSDVYAAGLIFFELLTGRRPFDFEEPSELIRSHLLTPPPTMSETARSLSLPPEVEAFVSQALEKSPTDRFTDGINMLQAFDELPLDGVVRSRLDLESADPEVQRNFALDATRPVRQSSIPPAPSARPRSRGRIAMVLGGVLFGLVAVGGFGAVLWWKSQPDPVAAIAGEPPADVGEPADGEEPVGEDPSEPESPEAVDPETPVEPNGEEASTAEAAGASDPRPRARNPWARSRRLPRALSRVRGQLRRGKAPSNRQLRPLKQYRRQNPRDLRAPLLVAHVYASRGWLSASLQQYQRVYQRDPSARGDPRMMRDLVRFAKNESVHEAAVAAVVEIYGQEALPRVAHELERTSDPEEQARLNVLQARLESS